MVFRFEHFRINPGSRNLRLAGALHSSSLSVNVYWNGGPSSETPYGAANCTALLMEGIPSLVTLSLHQLPRQVYQCPFEQIHPACRKPWQLELLPLG